MSRKLSSKKRVPLSESGLTLIETVIVAAIGSLLAVGVIAGQGEIRSRAQFTDSVEQAKNALMKIKNEANTTVNYGDGSDGTNTNQVFLAKRVHFWHNSNILWVDTIAVNNNLNTITVLGGNSVTLPWGARFRTVNSLGVASTSSKVIFVRWPPTGKLYVLTPPLGFVGSNFSDYDPTSAANRSLRLYQLEDVGNRHRAVLQVDGATGTIGRVFN